jgi:hypothetical protein
MQKSWGFHTLIDNESIRGINSLPFFFSPLIKLTSNCGTPFLMPPDPLHDNLSSGFAFLPNPGDFLFYYYLIFQATIVFNRNFSLPTRIGFLLR